MSSELIIPSQNIVCMIITCFVAFATPVGLAVYFRKKLKAAVMPFLIGCGMFVLFALILESLMHQLVLNGSGAFGETIKNNIWLYGVYGGMAAGIFDETGRLVGMKFLMKNKLTPQNALMYGAGHGGIEAMILVGVTYLSNIVLAFVINAGMMESVLGDTATQRGVMDSLATLATTSSWLFLLGGAERLIAITLQIALSIFVYIAVTQKGKWYMFLIAILIHAGVDFIAVVAMKKISVYAVELIILICTLVVAFIARKLYLKLKAQTVVEETLI
ncbi:MAG: YhfC family glutamic-type intramembrane protease [Mobilitalea sp.]